MSQRGYRFGVAATLFIFAVASHYLGVMMFRPDGPLYALADPAVGTFIGSDWQDRHYKIFAQYLPLLLVGFSLLWLFLTEYEEQTTTARRRR